MYLISINMGCINTKYKYLKVNKISKYHPLIEIPELSNRNNIFYSRDKRFFLKTIKSMKSLEIVHLKKCQNHKNIISIIEILQTSPNNLYIVMKKYDHDLFQIFANFNEFNLTYKNLFNIYLQIIDAIIFCHSKRIVHLDIKLENVMVKSIHPVKIKLIDFGLSRLVPKNNQIIFIKNKLGTKNYKAPEINKFYCTFKSDVYSLAMLIKISKELINAKIINDYLNFEKGLLKKCLSKDWRNRPSLKEISFYLKNRKF